MVDWQDRARRAEKAAARFPRMTENERQAQKICIVVSLFKTGTISAEDLVRYMLNQDFIKR